jgi:hypothetical protein
MSLSPGESLMILLPFHVSQSCYTAHNQVTLSQTQLIDGRILPATSDILSFVTTTPKTIEGRIFLDIDGDGIRSESEVIGVPYLRVIATDKETGLFYSAVSNSFGDYFIRDIPPGHYVLDAPGVHARDFRRTTQLPIEKSLSFLDNVIYFDIGYIHF